MYFVGIVRFFFVAIAVGSFAAAANAGPPGPCNQPQAIWEDNGHAYQAFCSSGLTWDEAAAAAEALGGYLVTINTAAENAFVFGLVDDPVFWYTNAFNAAIGPWLGAAQAPGSPEPGGGFAWVTNEPFLFTAWIGGEPNNSGNTENRAHFYGLGAIRGSAWNDITDTVPILGYVVEWEPTPSECSNGPIVRQDTDHTYQVVCALDDEVTWDEANDAALQAGGHLASITSTEENDFVFDLIDRPWLWRQDDFNAGIGPWIGGIQPPDSPEPGGGFTWANGEPFTFTAWSANEPNNLGSAESRVHYYNLPWPGRSAHWNDLTDNVRVRGYVIEWDPCTGDCDDSGMLTVDEIVLGVNIALGTIDVDDCLLFDGNDDGMVTVDEIVAAVSYALEGCEVVPVG
jgi:hypothetical protein